MSIELLLLVLAMMGLLCLAVLITLVLWLVRRARPGASPTDARETPAAPR